VYVLFVRRVYFMTCEIESDAKGQMDFLLEKVTSAQNVITGSGLFIHQIGLAKNRGNSGLEKGEWKHPSGKFLELNV
jgi:hypothetical protein